MFSLFLLLLFLLVKANAAILDQPESVYALRGENPTFHCQGNGSILWYINNTIYDFRNAEQFIKRGVLFGTPHLDGRSVSQDITVQTSTAGSNNTHLSCTVLGPGNEICTRNRATLVIIDVSDLKLSLLETNKFSITWDRANSPTGYNVDAYNITVTDQDGQILQNVSVDDTSERLQYTYISEQSRSEFPECSKLVFSVVAVANGTGSQGANVSWSGAERDLDMISGENCRILNSQSVQVSFDKPEICSYQTAHFSITIYRLKENTSDPALPIMPTLRGTVDNGGIRKLMQVLMVMPVIGQEYVAFIKVHMGNQSSRETQTRCAEFELSTEGLAGRKSTESLNNAEVAVLIVVTMVSVIVCVMNGLVIGYVVYNSKDVHGNN